MICIGCGDKILGRPYWVDDQPYCSQDCAEASLADVEDDEDLEGEFEEEEYGDYEEEEEEEYN